jgi:hypothetical protein
MVTVALPPIMLRAALLHPASARTNLAPTPTQLSSGLTSAGSTTVARRSSTVRCIEDGCMRFLTAAAGIIVLDDAESDGDIDQPQQQTPALMRARLSAASEHESRMRSTISSARRFALDLERTGAACQHATHPPLPPPTPPRPAAPSHAVSFSHTLPALPVLMSELVGSSSNPAQARGAAPLARISPSLREQQRASSANTGPRPPPATRAAAAHTPPDHLQPAAIIGGILLPLGAAIKPRSQSAAPKPRASAPRAHSSSASLSRPKPIAPPPAPLHRGIYTLARAGPSIITAWEASSSRAPAFCFLPPLIFRVRPLSTRRTMPRATTPTRPTSPRGRRALAPAAASGS